jgi:hypothetical protein
MAEKEKLGLYVEVKAAFHLIKVTNLMKLIIFENYINVEE